MKLLAIATMLFWVALTLRIGYGVYRHEKETNHV